MEEELWIDITGYENIYQISNLGRVKSLKRNFIKADKILKGYVNKFGYLKVGLKKVGIKPKLLSIHRLVCLAFLPIIENKNQVNHKDMNKLNNNLSNLEWCTNQENIDHCNSFGFSQKRIDNFKLQGKKLGERNTNGGKQVQGFVNEVLVYDFITVMKAKRQTNIDNSSICKCCIGKVKYAGKLNGEPVVWRYKDTLISEIL